MMRRYNLFFTSLSGQMVGGGQRSLLLLLQRLNRKRFTPYLACPSEGNFKQTAERLGIKTVLIKTGRLRGPKFFAALSSVWKFIRFIRDKKIDLVHTDSPRQTFCAGIAARLTGKPLIWHLRVSDPEKKIFDKLLLSLATKVIAVSNAARKRLERFAPQPEKIAVIPNGVDLKEFGPHLDDKKFRCQSGIEDDCLLIGTIGQILPRKGQEILLKAAADVARAIPQIKFVIVGDGNENYRKKLQALSQELGVEEKVLFTGYREDVPQILGSLDIFVLGSTDLEGFSRVILEAMASSKPVIATELGGNPEAVEDGITGMLVPPGDSERLAEAILDLAQDEKKRKRMGTAARERVEKLFSIERNVALTEKLYEELLCRDSSTATSAD